MPRSYVELPAFASRRADCEAGLSAIGISAAAPVAPYRTDEAWPSAKAASFSALDKRRT